MENSRKVILRKELRDPLREEVDDDLDNDWEWIQGLAAMIKEDESKMAFVNQTRVQQLKYAKLILMQIMQGREVRIEEKIHDPYPSVGCVSVIGKEIEVEDMNRFLKVVDLASNLDIFTKTDGTIQMDFTFHGLMFKGGIVR